MRSRRDDTGAPEPAAAPAPRTNPELQGHESAEQSLRQLLVSGRMPHALLLCGPRGIGKATLAFRFARFILANGSENLTSVPTAGAGLAIAEDSGVFRRVAAAGHADLLTIERGYDPRRRRLRAEIVVDDARDIASFLRLTPAEGGWRVVIVDGADEMNRNAANALLKILEEPPRRSLLLLVAHNAGRLLPTIRSRVRRLPLSPLPPTVVERLLARYRPDLPATQVAGLVALSGGSIGRALELAAVGGVELYHEIVTLLSNDNGIDPVRLHGFADRVVRGEAEEAYRVVEELLAQLLARLAVTAAGNAVGIAETPDSPLLARLSRRLPASRWAELRERIGQDFARTDDLNLDRKQTLLSTFLAIDANAG